jgi:hypothetical protein
MYEKYMICTRDFRNVSLGGQTTGFQLKIRINYYRGCYLSMIDTVRLVVDGEEFTSEKLTFSLANQTYSFEQLAGVKDVRWFFGDAATVTVQKPGGLRSGLHTVQLGLFIRNSYIPRIDRENLYDFSGMRRPDGLTHYGEPPVPLPLAATKRITLVQ